MSNYVTKKDRLDVRGFNEMLEQPPDTDLLAAMEKALAEVVDENTTDAQKEAFCFGFKRAWEVSHSKRA